MMQVSSILNKYSLKMLRPGENDESFEFSGAGVCILAKRINNDTEDFSILRVYESENPLVTAQSLLKQPRSDDSYLYAILLPIPTLAERRLVCEQIAPYCTDNTQ